MMRRWGFKGIAGLFILGLASASCATILGIEKDYHAFVDESDGGGGSGSQSTDGGDGCTGCVVDCDAVNEVQHPTTFHCYRLLLDPVTWQGAHAACEAQGLGFVLANLTTTDEIDLVAQLIPNVEEGDAWIAGSDIGAEGVYVWDSGEPWTYTPKMAPWYGYEPSDEVLPGDEDCVQLIDGAGVLNDDACNSNALAICERSPAGQL
jgi:hypothetical protein